MGLDGPSGDVGLGLGGGRGHGGESGRRGAGPEGPEGDILHARSRSTRGADRWKGRSTRGRRTVETEAHASAEQKNWVPGEGRTKAQAGTKQVCGCRTSYGGRTDYIYGQCARQDP